MQGTHQATQRGFSVGNDCGAVDGNVEGRGAGVVVDCEDVVSLHEKVFEDGEVTLAVRLGPFLVIGVVVFERTETLDTEVQVRKVDQVISRQLSLLIILEDGENVFVIDEVC